MIRYHSTKRVWTVKGTRQHHLSASQKAAILSALRAELTAGSIFNPINGRRA